MKRIFILLLLGLAAWQGYGEYKPRRAAQATSPGMADVSPRAPDPAGRFRCDGRTYCSQITSCEEATFFLKNCPA
jgi:hypothetical protein